MTGERPPSSIKVQEVPVTAVPPFKESSRELIAEVARDKADLEQKTLDYKRAQDLYNGKLISKSDFDAKKAAYDVGAATLSADEAKVVQMKAQMASTRGWLEVPLKIFTMLYKAERLA